MTTIEALTGFEAKRFRTTRKGYAVRKMQTNFGRESQCQRFDSHEGFIVTFVVRACAEKLARKDCELPDIGYVEQLPTNIFPGFAPALHLISPKRRVSLFVCTTAVGLNHPRKSVICEGQQIAVVDGR